MDTITEDKKNAKETEDAPKDAPQEKAEMIPPEAVSLVLQHFIGEDEDVGAYFDSHVTYRRDGTPVFNPPVRAKEEASDPVPAPVKLAPVPSAGTSPTNDPRGLPNAAAVKEYQKLLA